MAVMIRRGQPLLLCLAAPLACSPSSSGAGGASDAGPVIPATGPIAEQTFPAAIAQAICGKVTQCGCDWTKSAPCTMDSVCTAFDCLMTYTARYQDAVAQAPSRGEVYDPQGARTCVDAIHAADCRDVDFINLCTITWHGTQGIGQPCGATQVCNTTDAAPTECGPAGTCVVSSPSAPVGPAMGAACSGTCSGNSCVELFGASGGLCRNEQGLTCVGGVCTPLLTTGAACTDKFQCADPLACIGGACAPRLANGTSCTMTVESPCQAGSGCVTTTNTCATLKANGQSCTDPSECVEDDCVAGQCVRLGALPICGP
jgi:hypothetical protein